MTRPDDAMERVLEGLRDVKAPVGMERRILDRLESRAEERGRVGWKPLWLVGMARPGVVVTCGVGVAALIVCVLGILVAHRAGVTGGVSRYAPVRAAEVTTDVARGQVAAARRTVENGSGAVKRQAAETVAEETSVASDMDAVAMSETKAASFPAPPMPLTEQEKLILRMVREGNSVELAMLDPKMEALRDAEEKEEFQRFFAKPVVKEASQADESIEPGAKEQMERSATSVSGETDDAAPKQVTPVEANAEPK